MKNRSFTLIELLIVLVIIGVLVTLAIPQYQIFREKAIAAEAVNMMGAKVREVQEEVAAWGGYSLAVYESIERPKESKYWEYGHGCAGVGTDDVCYVINAIRTSGPYEGYYIGLKWLAIDNTTKWSGSHPGVPGGPTEEPKFGP